MQAKLTVSRVLCFVAMSLAANAADFVVPPSFSNVEAPSFTRVPFGRRGAVRIQQVFWPSYFPSGKLTLKGISMRGDSATATPAKTGVDMEIFLGSGAPDSNSLSNEFSKNRPADFISVFKRKTINLPALTSGPGPRPFNMIFAFDTPFAYNRKKGYLLVEIVVYNQKGSGHTCDTVYLCTSKKSSFGRKGCKNSAGMVPSVYCPTVNVQWGGKFALVLDRVKPNSMAIMNIGTRTKGNWAGMGLPLDLTPYGAPGCFLNLNMVIINARSADSTGKTLFNYTIPSTPEFLGHWVLFQGITLDAKANALGIALSLGGKVNVCGPEAVGRVYNYNLTGKTGVVQPGLAHVLRFSSN